AEVRLQNMGTGPDQYALHVGQNMATAGWQIEASPPSVALAPGATTAIALTITPPISATVGLTNTILISVTSQTTGQTIGPAQLQIGVLPHRKMFPIAPR
ncbi:MAG: hypothetical protein KDE47_31290, partial [Caldilineaceae bacterium]|nr:hypothetical protein [Caldilineaceae bacterium]